MSVSFYESSNCHAQIGCIKERPHPGPHGSERDSRPRPYRLPRSRVCHVVASETARNRSIRGSLHQGSPAPPLPPIPEARVVHLAPNRRRILERYRGDERLPEQSMPAPVRTARSIRCCRSRSSSDARASGATYKHWKWSCTLIYSPTCSAPEPAATEFVTSRGWQWRSSGGYSLYVVFRKNAIVRDDSRRFGLRLCDEKTVEWISVMVGKRKHTVCVRGHDGQNGQAGALYSIGKIKCRNPGKIELPEAGLDRDFQRRNSRSVNGV